MEILLQELPELVDYSSHQYYKLQAGQAEETYEWIVPDGVTLIHAVCIGPGGYAGGGLSWTNNIAVKPGDTMIIEFKATPDGDAGGRTGYTRLSRSSANTVLCIAYAGGRGGDKTTSEGGIGGKAADIINAGGGNGGRAIWSATGSGPSKGGAGGYNGNGGDGVVEWNGTGGSGKGGGGGGSWDPDGLQSYNGGNTGMWGQGDDGKGGFNSSGSQNGKDGSILKDQPSGRRAGGGYRAAPHNGGIRIIWGPGRSFPFDADDTHY